MKPTHVPLIDQPESQAPQSMGSDTVPTLALRPRQAARALNIGVRLLWSLTNQGLIPHVRLGAKAIVYPVSALEKWLKEQAVEGRADP